MNIVLLLIQLSTLLAQIDTAQRTTQISASTNQTDRSSKVGGAITGRIIGADGQPVADADVFAHRISENTSLASSTASDENGNFKLTGLSPGAYVLTAQAPGYISADLPVENAIHRIGENVIISLVKGGVITGRVTDEAGESLVGVTVSTYRLRDPEGPTMGSQVERFNLGFGVTDDRGIYRIYGLRPGVYIVSIGNGIKYSIDDAQIRRDTPTYYPSATRDTATEINLRGGEEVTGIDIRHRAVRGRVVSGSVSGDIQSPYQTLSVMLRGFETGQFEAETSLSSTLGFAFYGVPDGEYELTAGYEGETSGSATDRISVKGTDVNGIKLKLTPRGAIAGRIRLETSNPLKGCPINSSLAEDQTSGRIGEPVARRSVVEEIVLRAERDQLKRGVQKPRSYGFVSYGRVPNQKGEFALKNLEAGWYRIAVNLPDDGWHIRSITQPGVISAKASSNRAGTAKGPADISHNGIAIKSGEKLSGIEVIVAEGAATLKGRVVTQKDELPSLLRAHLIPAEAASADDVLLYAEAEVRNDGSFIFKHIVPAKYLIHTRRITEGEANDDQFRPSAWDVVERTNLRREASAAKNEIELQPCARVKDYVLRYLP